MEIEVITRYDLEEFRKQLLNDIKELLPQAVGTKEREWIKGKEVRKLLDVSPGTLQNLRVSGRLKFNRVGGTFYYKLSEIRKMMSPE